MTELTQKLLTLDFQTNEALKISNKLAQEMMLEVDVRVKEMMNEAEKLLEKQKENDLKVLTKNIEQKKLLEINKLEKNMQDFDKHFDISNLVDRLIVVAKEKVCP